MWSLARTANLYYWLAISFIYFMQLLIPVGPIVWFAKVSTNLFAIGFLAGIGLDCYVAYEISSLVYQYSIMRSTIFNALTVEITAAIYAYHLRKSLVLNGDF